MLNNIRISTRLILGFGVVLMLTTSTTFYSIYSFYAIQGNLDNITRAKYDSAFVMILIITGIAVVLASFIAWYLTRSIVRPLNEGVAAVDAFADGNMNRDIKVSGNNEISALLSGLQNMVLKLRAVIANVKISADNVATGSQLLSKTSDDLSNGSQELTTQFDQIVSAMTEVSQTITDVAKNALLAANASKKASDAASLGKEMVDTSAADMVQIACLIDQAAGTVEDLGKSSVMIGEIVEVINDIADQTNLLALNAAIEAARAGEQGRGFAVVADEVKKLAERTSQSTKVIAQRVNGIQAAAMESVNAIKRGSSEVEKGVCLAKEASSALDSIVAESAIAMNMVELIATATEQQSAASEEVTRNMENISHISKRSTGAAKQIKTSAADLSGLTIRLKEMISFFKGTTEEAEAIVKKAIGYIKDNGRDKGFAEINNPKGEFVNRDLYIFVYDMNGKCIAHGRDTGKIGKIEIDLKDANNVFFVKERIEIARTKGKGWQNYQTTNPTTKKIEDKTAYLERYDDFIVGSGAYK